MLIRTPTRSRPGRKPSIAAHPACAEIELARAAGDSLQVIADRFGVGRGSINRHWHAMSPARRARLAELADELRQYEARIRTAFAALAAAEPQPSGPAGQRRPPARSAGRSHAAA
ncbi:MAG: hypothetical protein ABW003_07290 [Microvirga sp.]